MRKKSDVIGVDFGTDTVRSIVVDAETGETLSSSVFCYPRWNAGKYCDPQNNQFRQHPLDYIEGLEHTITEALSRAPGSSSGVRGITMDTTGSTPVAVRRDCTPLSLAAGFGENPNAMFILWKDHTAVREAGEINALAHSGEWTDYTVYSGGVYSSEWFWSKILHTLRFDEKVASAAWSWMEHCDWMTALLTGAQEPGKVKRSRCAAGHKAMWHDTFGGLPSMAFLDRLHPALGLLRERLFRETSTVDQPAGTLSADWAKRLGLPSDVVVGVGAFDAHLGAVGAGIEPYILTKVIGTSTCDMLVAPLAEMKGVVVKGICGQVEGSVIPGMLGMEAGQSAFGDIYAWFRQLLSWPLEKLSGEKAFQDKTGGTILQKLMDRIIPLLSEEAEKRPIDEQGILSMDWMNGRRTPDANQMLKGAITGLSLGSDAPAIFRSLVESTAFGAKMIVERFISEGVPIKGIIALGGVAQKAPFVMQVLADVLDMPIRVAAAEQAVALGSAMAAATASGIYGSIEEAQKAMNNGFEKEYRPNAAKAAAYQRLYSRYKDLGRFIEHSPVSG